MKDPKNAFLAYNAANNIRFTLSWRKINVSYYNSQPSQCCQNHRLTK